MTAALWVYDSDGFPASAALLAYIAAEAMQQHEPDKLTRLEYGFINGLWAAIGILIDPPTAEAGVLDFAEYTRAGLDRIQAPKPMPADDEATGE